MKYGIIPQGRTRMKRNEIVRSISLVATASAIMLLMLSMALSPVAYASKQEIHVSGTWTYTVTSVISTATVGGNTIQFVTFSETLTGSISGTRVGVGTFIIHSDGS